MNSTLHEEIKQLYGQLIEAWNNRDSQGMTELFTGKGVQIGFDGSKLNGQTEIQSHLTMIFEQHPTPPFVTKVKDIRPLGADVAILHAIAGMIPPGKNDIEPTVNAHQTLVARKVDKEWGVELFQNTPAQYHGRPELVEEMTDELSQLLK